MKVRSRSITLGALALLLAMAWAGKPALGDDDGLRRQASEALRRAVAFYRGRVASHGGYVYYYTPDLARRWGEGEATRDQVWVQPPGTPRVGMAYLEAYAATGDPTELDAAREAAEALAYGQLESGGWTNAIDFDPRGARVARYRNGRGGGRNASTLDDGITQSAIRLLARVDRALGFKDARIHESARVALDALLRAQLSNGGFPQVWTGPSAPRPVASARYPDHDWRTEGKIKNYWDMATLNDGLAGTVARALIEAFEVYRDPGYRSALARLGDFLILAQMPDPQPAWAQQYDDAMRPIWARKFEPPAITGWESQDVLEALLAIHRVTNDPKYLAPIPRALAYLERCRLPDGRLARYYELRTNRPLYMTRTGDDYALTHDDSDLPRHYGWKFPPRLDRIRREYESIQAGAPRPDAAPEAGALEPEVRRVVEALDAEGRWVSTYAGEPLVGQPRFAPGTRYLSSEVFARNVETLAAFLRATRGARTTSSP